MQRAFLAEYEKLKSPKHPNDVIVVMYTVHPQHDPDLGDRWIKHGKGRQVRSNSGRRRVGIDGAIALARMERVMHDDTINADPTTALFDQPLLVYANATCIHVTCDTARDYRSTAVREYLGDSHIKLIFCPPRTARIRIRSSDWGNSSRKRRSIIATVNHSPTFGAPAKSSPGQFPLYRDRMHSLTTDNFATIGKFQCRETGIRRALVTNYRELQWGPKS